MIIKLLFLIILGQTPAFMHVVAGGIKLNNAEGEEEKRDLEKIIGKHLSIIVYFLSKVKYQP